MLEAPTGELGEEPLDGVEPGTGGGREVEGPAGMARKPFADLGVLVSGIIVDDHVDDLPCRDVAFEGVQEADELLMPVALRIPTKPAMHSNLMPATYSDFIPAGIPI